jgi:hypothetical protein
MNSTSSGDSRGEASPLGEAWPGTKGHRRSISRGCRARARREDVCQHRRSGFGLPRCYRGGPGEHCGLFDRGELKSDGRDGEASYLREAIRAAPRDGRRSLKARKNLLAAFPRRARARGGDVSPLECHTGKDADKEAKRSGRRLDSIARAAGSTWQVHQMAVSTGLIVHAFFYAHVSFSFISVACVLQRHPTAFNYSRITLSRTPRAAFTQILSARHVSRHPCPRC